MWWSNTKCVWEINSNVPVRKPATPMSHVSDGKHQIGFLPTNIFRIRIPTYLVCFGVGYQSGFTYITQSSVLLSSGWHVLPADTWRNNNVIVTSKRRHNVVLTRKWRYYYVMCPLGYVIAAEVSWTQTSKCSADKSRYLRNLVGIKFDDFKGRMQQFSVLKNSQGVTRHVHVI